MYASCCAANASFSSRSSRFGGAMPATAPDPGSYDSYNINTMAAAAKSLSRSPSAGAFGGRSVRDLPWHRQSDDGATAEDAPVRSSFGSASARGAPPSAAFAGHANRFVTPRDSTPGPGSYSARTPLSPSTRVNRSASFGGRSQRFGNFKEAQTPAPGTFDAKPGAFAEALRKPRAGGSGFGSRSHRGSPFAASVDANAAPAPGAYDAANGAFASAASTARASSPRSASFASRSSRFDRPGSTQANAGPDPTAYDPLAYGSMAKAAGKTFNKHPTSSARRARRRPAPARTTTPVGEARRRGARRRRPPSRPRRRCTTATSARATRPR